MEILHGGRLLPTSKIDDGTLDLSRKRKKQKQEKASNLLSKHGTPDINLKLDVIY